MKDDKLRYTKLGLVNALLSLIPIFPAWTLFPGIFFGTVVGHLINNCELGYSITLWTCFGLTAFLLFRYFSKFELENVTTRDRQLKKRFRIFSLEIYSILNTAILIIILGTNTVCSSDGQTLFACFLSGPLASIGLIMLGVAVDIRIGPTLQNNEQNQ
jgi:hypothetical protein